VNIEIQPEELTNNVQPVRVVGLDRKVRRGVRLYLADGSEVTFWLSAEVIAYTTFNAMGVQAHMLREEEINAGTS